MIATAMASLILAAAPPAHLRALAPDVLDAPDSAQRAAIEATIARRTAAFASTIITVTRWMMADGDVRRNTGGCAFCLGEATHAVG